MIKVRDLSKWYGPTLAVDRLNFSIEPGQIVGFLGPNGAGKTTTMRMITGFIPPTHGSVIVDGIDVAGNSRQARQKIGYLPEHTPLYDEMRVDEYLDYRGRLYEMDRRHRKARAEVVIDRCGLSDVRRRVISRLSKGNRQRVGLAQALLHEPPLLILDEPTAGLDPNQVSQVRQLFADLRGKHTILLSTHILPEVEKIADRAMIIARGQVVADGGLDALRQSVRAGACVVTEVQAGQEQVRQMLGQIDGVASVQVQQDGPWCRARVSPGGGGDLREAVGRAISAKGWAVRELRLEHATLERFFVEMTARQSQATDQTPAA